MEIFLELVEDSQKVASLGLQVLGLLLWQNYGFYPSIQNAHYYVWKNIWIKLNYMYVVNLYNYNPGGKKAIKLGRKINKMVSRSFREGNFVANKLANQTALHQSCSWWSQLPSDFINCCCNNPTFQGINSFNFL